MGPVWIVATGSYSDYHVHSVWATQELAEAFAARLCDSQEPFLEEVRDALPQPVSILSMRCRIETPDATVRDEVENIDETWLGEDTRREVRVGAYPLDVYSSNLFGRPRRWMDVVVFGTDHEAVRKTYSEKKAFAVSQFDILVAAKLASRLP